MLKLINDVKHYPWGSFNYLHSMFNIISDGTLPMAELWMGAHPKGTSVIKFNSHEEYPLIDFISKYKETVLGHSIAVRFDELPFLFKVLCADKALSIQVHPSKSAAETGFAKENDAGVPLDSPVRNYKDANHKPELVFALTPFRAMNAFRELYEIAELLRPVQSAHSSITNFIQRPDTAHLKDLFSTLLSLQGEEKSNALSVLKHALSSEQGIAWNTITDLIEDYPDDVGLFMPLLLNVIELQPGEAMFLHAETPHAYFKGVGLEVMANSDNVLRAGLTPKHIDIPELLANVIFEPVPFNKLKTDAITEGDTDFFPVPVDDFSFSIHHVKGIPSIFDQNGPAIIFCIEGNVVCSNGKESLSLTSGESVFIGANEPEISLSGHGRIARAYAEL